MKLLLATASHRKHPYPSSPWVMTQRWDDLLFAHWRFEPHVVRSLIPPQLELDTFDGAAWVGVVPFKMRNVRPRWTPTIPPFSSNFLELNVRTYVVKDGIPGVYFFSLDASNLWAVEGARIWFHLPYYYAEMRVHEKDGWFHYRSRRLDKRGEANELIVQYAADGETYQSSSDSIEHFLTERYCLYTISGDGQLLRVHIHHIPWPLQKAKAQFSANSMMATLGLTAEGDPICHFAASILTIEWAPEVVL